MKNKPLWIIENIVKEESYQEPAKTVELLGFPLVRLNGDYIRKEVQKHNLYDGPIIIVGSIEINKLMQEDLPRAYSFSTFKNYLCSVYYPKIGNLLFNDKYMMMPLKEFARQKWFVYNSLAAETMVFVRPDSGDKTFKAGLVDIEEVDKFCEQFDDQLILISNPKNINAEFRFVVNDRKEIIAWSSYRFKGLTTRVPSAPKKCTKFVEKVLEIGYFPDKVFCIDVAEDNDGNYWLLELTSFSSAGLYKADKKAIVEKVSQRVLEDIK